MMSMQQGSGKNANMARPRLNPCVRPDSTTLSSIDCSCWLKPQVPSGKQGMGWAIGRHFVHVCACLCPSLLKVSQHMNVAGHVWNSLAALACWLNSGCLQLCQNQTGQGPLNARPEAKNLRLQGAHLMTLKSSQTTSGMAWQLMRH